MPNSNSNSGSTGSGGSSARPSNNNRPRRKPYNKKGRGRGPKKPLGVNGVFTKYQQLLEKHINARKEYYEFYFRVDPNRRNKLERLFYDSLNEMRRFEDSLHGHYKELFDKKFNGLPIDDIYTINHNLPQPGPTTTNNTDEMKAVISETPPEEPHLLQSQIEADYADDTEEGLGTIDDYKRMKGLI